MKRKFVMRVGPTNVEKMHITLCALAGVSNLPLYTRFGSGRTRDTPFPLLRSLNLARAPGTPCTEIAPPNSRSSIIFPREKEIRVVADDAPLTSSSTEMVNFDASFDVAVVDEI